MSDLHGLEHGRAILASPFLEDSNFERAVVYMVRHTPEDAFGLIINRPTEHTIESVMELAAEMTVSRTGWLHYGGPVEGPLVALHDQPDLADLTCSHGIYLTTNRDQLLPLLNRKSAKLKLCTGFSGWGPGQLESEQKTGSWIVTEITPEQVLLEFDELWKSLLHCVGHQILAETGFDLGDPSKARWN